MKEETRADEVGGMKEATREREVWGNAGKECR